MAFGLPALLAAAACVLDERPVVAGASCDGTQCTCQGSHADCDGQPENGCETDTSLDPQHCGRCGRDCRGGGCNAGQCTPYLLTEPFAQIRSLVVHAGEVYFCDGHAGGIVRVSADGGTPELVAWDQPCTSEMAAAEDRLYWVAQRPYDQTDLLYSATLEDLAAGQPPEALWSHELPIASLSAHGDHAAWAVLSFDYSAVYAFSTATQEIRELPVAGWDQLVTTVAVSGEGIGWASTRDTQAESKLYWSAHSSAAAEVMREVEDYRILDLNEDQGILWWIECAQYGLGRAIDPFCRLMRRSLSGGAEEEVVAASSRSLSQLRVQGSVAYWAEALTASIETEQMGNWIHRLEAGGTRETLAGTLEVERMSLGEDALFWADEPGKIMALAK